MNADLTLAGYSPGTRANYLSCARLYTKHFKRPPAEMSGEEVRAYLLHLIEKRKASCSTVRGARAALLFLYAVTLQRPVEVANIPIVRRRRRLPVVLSGTEVNALLQSIASPMYRAILMAIYAGGLRISEACRLRPEDIDSKRMVIHIRDGKGGRDRYTVLSTRLLDFLREYWRAFRPKGWLFPGFTAAGHVSPNAVRKVFALAIANSAIPTAEATGLRKKRVTPHTLRHSFATHLLECGTDVTVIQSLLGHSSLRATSVYTHVSVEHIGRTKSPLDVLGTKDAAVLG
jgi:site-specific recombinase XerD